MGSGGTSGVDGYGHNVIGNAHARQVRRGVGFLNTNAYVQSPVKHKMPYGRSGMLTDKSKNSACTNRITIEKPRPWARLGRARIAIQPVGISSSVNARTTPFSCAYHQTDDDGCNRTISPKCHFKHPLCFPPCSYIGKYVNRVRGQSWYKFKGLDAYCQDDTPRGCTGPRPKRWKSTCNGDKILTTC